MSKQKMKYNFSDSAGYLILPFFFPGMTIQANMYSKMLISWTSQKMKEAYNTRNAFDFKHGKLIEVFRKKANNVQKSWTNRKRERNKEEN